MLYFIFNYISVMKARFYGAIHEAKHVNLAPLALAMNLSGAFSLNGSILAFPYILTFRRYRHWESEVVIKQR